MKKLFFQALCCALFLGSFQASAQLQVGFNIGYSDANQQVNIDNSFGALGVEAESRGGFNLGAFLELGENKVKFQPEINFTSGGSVRPDTIAGDRTHKFSYLNVPLQAKWYIYDNDKFSFYASAGAYVGFAIGGKVEVESGDNVDDPFDVLGYDRLDFGALGSIGGTYAVGEGRLFVELRSLYGLKKVQKDEISGVSGFDFNAKNRISQFNVGYIMSF